MPLRLFCRADARKEQTEEVANEGRYATEEEAFVPGTRKLKPGYRWGRGADKGNIVRV